MIRGTEKTARSREAIRLYLCADLTLSEAARRMGLRWCPRLWSPVRRHTKIRRAVRHVLDPQRPCSVEEACRRVGIQEVSNVYTMLRKQGTPIVRPPRKIDRALNLYLTADPPMTLGQVARYFHVSCLDLTTLVGTRGRH